MRRPGLETVTLLLLAGAVTLIAVVRGQQEEASRRLRGPTTFSARREGTRALYELCRTRGIHASRLISRRSTLPANEATIVIIEPLMRAMEPEDVTRLKEWVRGGGRLIVCVTHDSTLAGALGVAGFPDQLPSAPVGTFRVTGDRDLVRDIRAVSLGHGPVLTVESGRPVLLCNGNPVAREKHEGEGTILALSSALAPLNRRIGESDNAVLWMNILEGGRGGRREVVFLEAFHRPEPAREVQGRWWLVLPAEVRYAGWFTLLLLTAAVWNGNQRTGRLIERPAPGAPRETAGELYVYAMGRLLQRAHCPELAIENLHHAFCHDLARRLGAPPHADRQTLLGLLPPGAASRHEVDRLLQFGEEVAAGKDASEQELLQYARSVRGLRRELGLD